MHIPTKEEAKIIIAELLSEPIRRKILIEKCIDKLSLPAEVIKDRRPDQPYNKTKCIFGHAVTELLSSGILVQSDGIVEYREKLDKQSATESVKRDIEIDKTLRRLLAKRAYTRKEILTAVATELKADKDFVKVVKADAGRLLNEAVKNGDIVKSGNNYSLPAQQADETANQQPQQPKTAAQAQATAKNAVKKPEQASAKKTEPNVKQKSAKKRKNAVESLTISDEEFVDKTVLMLETWYKSKGFTKLESKNIDGPDDGGIDGIIRAWTVWATRTKYLFRSKTLTTRKSAQKSSTYAPFAGWSPPTTTPQWDCLSPAANLPRKRKNFAKITR